MYFFHSFFKASKKEENPFKFFKITYNTLLTIIILVVVLSFIGKT